MPNKKHGIRYTTASFVEKAKTIHGDYYNYALVSYKNSSTKINIICPVHGQFEQRPCDHINQKQGCPKCSHNYPVTIDSIRRKSKIKYGEQYIIVGPFNGIKYPLKIICTIDNHGEFITSSESHFQRAGGCPKCSLSVRMKSLKPGNISKIETLWLDSLNVPVRQHSIVLNGKLFIVDGFDPKTNTVYECYGSYWHGNPEKYAADHINTRLGKTFGSLYQKTILREKVLKSSYNVISLWV